MGSFLLHFARISAQNHNQGENVFQVIANKDHVQTICDNTTLKMWLPGPSMK